MEARVYQDEATEWRWRIVASNGLTVATSSRGYPDRDECLDLVTELHPDLTIYAED